MENTNKAPQGKIGRRPKAVREQLNRRQSRRAGWPCLCRDGERLVRLGETRVRPGQTRSDPKKYENDPQWQNCPAPEGDPGKTKPTAGAGRERRRMVEMAQFSPGGAGTGGGGIGRPARMGARPDGPAFLNSTTGRLVQRRRSRKRGTRKPPTTSGCTGYVALCKNRAGESGRLG